MSQKVLEISADEAKYIDPNQIASIQMTDGTTIMIKDTQQAQEEFVEEAQDEQQYETQVQENKDGQKLRGRGVLGALAGAAAGAAILGTAAAIGGAAMRRPYGYGYGPMMGPPMMRPPMMRPPMMGPPMMRPPMMRPPMMGPPMMGPRMRGPHFF